MNSFKRKVLGAICIGLFTTSALAGGGAGGDATEITQLANNAELVTQVAQQAQHISYTLSQLNNMIQNTRAITNGQWGNAVQELQQLSYVVNQGVGISYAMQNIGEQFQTKFPGYRTSTNYNAEYQNWNQSTLDSIRGAMSAAGMQASQFADEASTMEALQRMSNTAQGRMEAIQVGNMIAMQTATQMQKLRQLQMAQMQAQNGYLAAQAQQQATDKATGASWAKRGWPSSAPGSTTCEACK